MVSPLSLETITKDCSELRLDGIPRMAFSLLLLFLFMKFVLLKKKKKQASKNRMAIPPKVMPNTSTKMDLLFCRFLELNVVLPELQRFASIGAHNFGFPEFCSGSPLEKFARVLKQLVINFKYFCHGSNLSPALCPVQAQP